ESGSGSDCRARVPVVLSSRARRDASRSGCRASPLHQPSWAVGSRAPHAGRVSHMRRSVLLVMLVMLLAAASAVPPAAMGQGGGGKTLIMALDQSDVKTLDPGREFEFGAAFVDLNCYDTLVAHKSPKE